MPRNKDVTRDAIVASALELFAERGYGAVRIEDVARAAGVSRATFYNHFSEREQILAALFERLLGPNGETADVDSSADGEPPLERIRTIVRDSIHRMLEQEELARFVYSLPVRHESLLKGDVPATPAVFRSIHRLLEQAMARGEIRDDVPVDLLCIHVHGALESAMRSWAEGATDDAIARADLLIDLALTGVVARSRPRRSAS
jgi:AcrR family transcriptional regulator